MPRLRKVQILKYGDLREDSDVYPIDSVEQGEIILKLKQKTNLSESKVVKLLFKGYLGLLLFLNLILITVPYYRQRENAIFSASACIMLFIPIIFAYSTIHPSNFNHTPILQNVTFIKAALVTYIFVTCFKFVWFRQNLRADLIYTLPILVTICIIDVERDTSKLSKAIGELEMLKYDYKEA